MAKSVTKSKQAKSAGQPAQNGLEHYRRMLLEKADEINRFMSTPTAAETLTRREEPNDYVDLAGQSHEEWIFLNRNAQCATQLRQVEDALDRIQEGKYGVCVECGQQISQKRLEAVPWADHCISCQEKRGPWTN